MRLSARFFPTVRRPIQCTLPHPYLRRFARQPHRRDRAALRLGASQARSRRRAVHRPARPLRPDAARGRPGLAGVQGRRDAARRVGRARRRQGAPAPRRDRERRTADRRGRSLRQRDRGAVQGGRAAAAGVRRAGLSGGDPAQVSLPRSAPREAAQQHHHARAGHRVDPPPHDRAGLLRIPDADPDGVVAGRRARLPRAVAPASGQVLRAAAGAAAVQAAPDGLGLRPLLPDRALLPRRGRARRPLARRVLSARRRDELRHAGGRVRRGRAGDARRVRGVRRRQAGDAEVSADPLRASARQVRHRQAGPAQPDRDAGRLGEFPRRRLRLFARILERAPRTRCGRSPRRAAARAPSATA